MKDESEDLKRQAILQSAWNAFAAYGYRRTAMDDIARGAGMSRPALYLHYRNKEAIFRSLVEFYYVDVAARITEALAGADTVPDAITAAFEAQGGDLAKAMLTSQHGLELLDTGMTVASDIVTEGEARLAGVYADWLRDQQTAGKVRLPDSPERVAGTFTAALKGIKKTAESYEAYCARVSVLAALIGTAITR